MAHGEGEEVQKAAAEVSTRQTMPGFFGLVPGFSVEQAL